MAPILFSGALPPKKKSELQQIATALQIDTSGTKDDLQSRIKRHLDANQGDLEDDPIFSGLFGGRRRRSVPRAEPSVRKLTIMNPIRESTPVDRRDVSAYLKADPFSPNTPSSLPHLPDSPDQGREVHIVDKSIGPFPPRSDFVQGAERIKLGEEHALRSANEGILSLRTFLSDSKNIWTLTVVAEFLYIVQSVTIWQTFEVKIGATTSSIFYPDSITVSQPCFWPTLAIWFFQTLFIPALVGTLISFSPAVPSATLTSPAPFDPLTASIVRLAMQFLLDPSATGLAGAQDPLGVRLRVTAAAVGVAFAFAESIKNAPVIWANDHLKPSAVSDSQTMLPQVLTAEDTVVRLE